MEDSTVLLSRPDAPRQIVLEDAIAAGVLPTWAEAVALTRAIAWQLYRAGSSAPVPDLSEIALFSTGVIHLEGGQPHDGGQIAGVGEVMGDLLEHVSAPPQVMDVQRQAMAQPPVFATLLEFHNALDFFARPDSKAVLADYHSRATAALDQSAQNDFLSELKEKTKAQQPEQAKRKKERKKLPRWVPIAAAALVLGVGGVAAFFMFGRSSAPVVQQSTDAALSLLAETGKKMQDATTNVVSKLIGGATEAAPAEAPAANVSPAAAPAPVPRRRLTPTPQQQPMAVSQSPAGVASSPSEPAAPPPPAAAEPAAPPAAVVDVGVYTAADATVEGPVLVYPQLPTKPTRDLSATKPGELDLLVLEDGTVAEARLIPQSDRLQDRMLISAAKAWRFRPATKDGRPVRYRTRIPITW